MHPECQERFPRHRGLAKPTCITAYACRDTRSVMHLGSLASGFLWSRWRGKRSRHSRGMRNSQLYVSVKRPMERSKTQVTTTSHIYLRIVRIPTFHIVEERKDNHNSSHTTGLRFLTLLCMMHGILCEETTLHIVYSIILSMDEFVQYFETLLIALLVCALIACCLL